MKSIYLKEATAEKLRPTNEKGYIQRMQRLAEKEAPFTFGVFKDTGRVFVREDYEKTYGDFCGHNLQEDTITVIVYINCTIIECNKEDVWSVSLGRDIYTNNNVEVIEKHLYGWLERELQND